MTTETAAKKDIQKLQRVIVDALEDVKAQEIVVFDTEKQTALFERVMIASGTSNRQTRALAMSVRDAVNKAGFGKPRVEGEDNGEWIIVDCGSAVVHVMQPAIRSYYHLEELWGDVPVRLKFGSEKVVAKSTTKKTPAKKLTATQEAMIQIDKGDKAEKPMTLKRSNAAKTGVAEAFPSKAAIKKEAAIKSTKAAAAKKVAAKTAAAKSPAAKKAAPAAKKVAAKKAPAKKAPAKKAAVKTV
jgi:ribosome-associated protein